MLISCPETVWIQNFQGPETYNVFLVMITKPHTFIFCNNFLMVYTFCFLQLQVSVFEWLELRWKNTFSHDIKLKRTERTGNYKRMHPSPLLLLCIASREAFKRKKKNNPQPCLFGSHPLSYGGGSRVNKKKKGRQPQQF